MLRWEKLRSRVRRLIQPRGAQRALARALGVSHQAVGQWINDQTSPAAKNVPLLLEWVMAEETKQKNSGSAVTLPGQTAQTKKPRSKPKSVRNQSLKAVLGNLGLSHVALAARSGNKSSYINRIVVGEDRGNPVIFHRIERALGRAVWSKRTPEQLAHQNAVAEFAGFDPYFLGLRKARAVARARFPHYRYGREVRREHLVAFVEEQYRKAMKRKQKQPINK